jgi:hypothetical protein
MPLNPSPDPKLSTSLPALTTSSVGHPDTWNPIHQALLDNDLVLHANEQASKQSAEAKLQSLDQRVGGIESSSAVSVQKAQALDWTYRNNVIKFEMFVKGYTLIDVAPVAVVQGVNGDDSLDVADTGGLRVGEFYVLTDPTALDGDGNIAPVSALVQVSAVLSGIRVRLAANMARDWGPSAFLQRSSIKVLGASNAAAVPGDIYLTRSINIGADVDGGAVVIRRTLNSGKARIYYRDAYQPIWKEAGWSLRRTGADIPGGFADYEYVLPMRGDGWLRLGVEDEAMTIAHIVALGQTTGLGGYINPELRPNTPVLSTPLAGAVGVTERPSLAIAGYSSPSGNAQKALQVQLSKTANFADIAHDSGVLPAAVSYSPPAGAVTAGATYYWRSRVQDVADLWSEWMTVASFTAAASFAYVAAPSITGPSANATDVPEQPTITLSAFVAIGGADSHKSSQVRIRAADGTYAEPVWDSGADAVNKLSMVVPAKKLKAGVQGYFLQARQEGTARGWSEWGAEIKITTKGQFANVIGIAMLASGGGAGTWARVDESGATKVTDASFFSSHIIYGAIQDQLIDGQYMVKIPAFYVRRDTIVSGANAGKKAIWVSDQPIDGFSLHPAFKNAGANLAQFWVGKYQGTSDETKLGSRPGLMPQVSVNLPGMQNRAAARNTGGVSGFAIWSIYQLSAIQTLAMIEIGGADSQALIGRGHVDGGSILEVDSALVAQASWRGIVGLWGNIDQMVDGLIADTSKNSKIWDRNGNHTYLSTNRTAPTSGTYPVTMAEDTGTDFDLRDVFLPATGDSSASNGSYGDRFFQGSGTNTQACHGGTNGTGSDGGLFALKFINVATLSYTYIGSRLAKV